MSGDFLSPVNLHAAMRGLKSWGSNVATQPSRHVWSVLPLKHAGASPGSSVEYTEELDLNFMTKFFKLRGGDRPFFDPFSLTWLPEGYYHSNLATSRKKTFNKSWNAGELDQNWQTLALDYAEIFQRKALTKSGVATRLPPLSCAAWFYKRPYAEWGATHPFVTGVPSAEAMLEQFRADFYFADEDEWQQIFDNTSPHDSALRETLT